MPHRPYGVSNARLVFPSRLNHQDEHGTVVDIVVYPLGESESQAHLQLAGQVLETPYDWVVERDGHFVHPLSGELSGNDLVHHVTIQCSLGTDGNLRAAMGRFAKCAFQTIGVARQVQFLGDERDRGDTNGRAG